MGPPPWSRPTLMSTRESTTSMIGPQACWMASRHALMRPSATLHSGLAATTMTTTTMTTTVSAARTVVPWSRAGGRLAHCTDRVRLLVLSVPTGADPAHHHPPGSATSSRAAVRRGTPMGAGLLTVRGAGPWCAARVTLHAGGTPCDERTPTRSAAARSPRQGGPSMARIARGRLLRGAQRGVTLALPCPRGRSRLLTVQPC